MWAHAAKRLMGTTLVVPVESLSDGRPHFEVARELLLPDALVLEAAEETLHK